MSTETKVFPTLAVLSVTTGRLLTIPRDMNEGNGIGQMYDLLGWMTGDSPFTHQLGRFGDECKPWIYRQHPNLRVVEQEIIDRCEAGEVKQVQVDMLARFGGEISLHRIPMDDHVKKNPYDELVEMRGSDEGILLLDASEE